MSRLLVAVLALPLLLAGCSSSGSQLEPAATQKPASAASDAPAPTPPVADPASATCKDRKGDGDGFDLRRVEVARVGAVERVSIAVDELPQLAMHDSASIVVSFYDRTGNHGGQFGTKWIGSERATYVYDLDAARNSYVDDLSVVDGRTITLAYPAELVDRAGSGWVWQTVTTLNGKDIDTCSTAAWKAVTG